MLPGKPPRDQARRQPIAPPVYSPKAKQTIQLKTSRHAVVQRALGGAGAPPPPGPNWAARLRATIPPAQLAAQFAAQQAAEQQAAAQRAAEQAAEAAAAAAAAAAQALADRQAIAPLGNVVLRGSCSTHYNDGWGARYAITANATLQARVRAEWVNGEAHDGSTCSFDLGTYTVGGHTSSCSVLYRKVWQNASTTWDADVWHCGPNTRAG
ncbi:MAG TPA: hypothetical protein VKB05_01360 [Pyrinomonadaceae bacterium]|nr:hypothetical protein [Pyrinomonadaceae bacterium]